MNPLPCVTVCRFVLFESHFVMSETMTQTPATPASLSQPVTYRLQAPITDFGLLVTTVEVHPLCGYDLMETAHHTNHESRVYALMARSIKSVTDTASSSSESRVNVGTTFIGRLHAEDLGALFEIVENFLPSGLKAIGIASRLGLDMSSILAPAKS